MSPTKSQSDVRRHACRFPCPSEATTFAIVALALITACGGCLLVFGWVFPG